MTGLIIFLIVIIILIGAVKIFSLHLKNNLPAGIKSFDQTISNGNVTVAFPSSDFGLAVNKDQILNK